MIALQKIMMMKGPSEKLPVKLAIFTVSNLLETSREGARFNIILIYSGLTHSILDNSHFGVTSDRLFMISVLQINSISSRILELLECLSYWSFELFILLNLSLMIQCI